MDKPLTLTEREELEKLRKERDRYKFLEDTAPKHVKYAARVYGKVYNPGRWRAMFWMLPLPIQKFFGHPRLNGSPVLNKYRMEK